MIEDRDWEDGRSLLQLLSGKPWHICSVKNGREALEKFRSDRFDLVVMRVNMSETGGYETAAVLRQFESSSQSRTPILGVSSRILKGDLEKCRESGIDDCISGGIGADNLCQKIRSMLFSESENKG